LSCMWAEVEAVVSLEPAYANVRRLCMLIWSRAVKAAQLFAKRRAYDT